MSVQGILTGRYPVRSRNEQQTAVSCIWTFLANVRILQTTQRLDARIVIPVCPRGPERNDEKETLKWRKNVSSETKKISSDFI